MKAWRNELKESGARIIPILASKMRTEEGGVMLISNPLCNKIREYLCKCRKAIQLLACRATKLFNCNRWAMDL
jgi:hypothetical protein